MKITIIGSLALHGINGVKAAVTFLSYSFSKIFEDIIPGTLHPVPKINGIKAFPLSPIFLKVLSKRNDILAIYPVDSKKEIHKNKTASCGKNDTTPPTPVIIPSETILIIQSETSICLKKFSITIFEKSKKSFIKSLALFPTNPTDKKYTKNIISTKIGNAKNLLRNILSKILVTFILFFVFVTHKSHT